MQDEQPTLRGQLRQLAKIGLTVTGLLGGMAYWASGTEPARPTDDETLEQRVEQTPAQEEALSVQNVYASQLQQQLDTKRRRFRTTIADSTIALGEQLINEYRGQQPTRMGLEDYVTRMDQTIHDTDIDWDRIAKTKFSRRVVDENSDARWVIDRERLPLAREIASSIDARQMLAYSLTELGTHKDAKRNIQELGKELSEAGLEYRHARMSQWDGLMSYGPCQITGPAVQEINRTQGTDLDLKSLRGDDHTEACYRLTVTNLAHAVSGMSRQAYENLRDHWREHKDDLAIAIGGLNFRQRDGSEVLEKYAEEGLRAQIQAYATGPRMHHYLSETGDHFRELHPGDGSSKDPSVRPLFTYVGKNTQGLDVHRVVVEPGHTATELSRVFDAYDTQVNGDRYRNTGYKNVVDVDGKPKQALSPQDTVYVLGREH